MKSTDEQIVIPFSAMTVLQAFIHNNRNEKEKSKYVLRFENCAKSLKVNMIYESIWQESRVLRTEIVNYSSVGATSVQILGMPLSDVFL